VTEPIKPVTLEEAIAMLRSIEWGKACMPFAKGLGRPLEQCPESGCRPCRHDYPGGCVCTELLMRGSRPPTGHYLTCGLGQLLERYDAQAKS
jgi:hypothetical protein